MSSKEKQQVSPSNRDSENPASGQLQEQIDALVHGESQKDPRSVRDLAKKPATAKESQSKGKR